MTSPTFTTSHLATDPESVWHAAETHGSVLVVDGHGVPRMRIGAPRYVESLEERLSVAERELEEYRRGGLLLPGFFCTACGVFTGTAREEHTHCRCCGEERP